MILVLNEGRAFSFIKSRKSDSRVMDMEAQMYQFAEKNGLELQDVLVDRKASYDLDRPIINQMMEGLETGKFSVILVRDIRDITTDIEQQEEFLRQVKGFGGEVISIYDGPIRINDDECRFG